MDPISLHSLYHGIKMFTIENITENDIYLPIVYCMAFWQVICNSVSCMHFMCTCSEYTEGLPTEIKTFSTLKLTFYEHI